MRSHADAPSALKPSSSTDAAGKADTWRPIRAPLPPALRRQGGSRWGVRGAVGRWDVLVLAQRGCEVASLAAAGWLGVGGGAEAARRRRPLAEIPEGSYPANGGGARAEAGVDPRHSCRVVSCLPEMLVASTVASLCRAAASAAPDVKGGRGGGGRRCTRSLRAVTRADLLLHGHRAHLHHDHRGVPPVRRSPAAAPSLTGGARRGEETVGA